MAIRKRVHEGVLYERDGDHEIWWPAYSLGNYRAENEPKPRIDLNAPLLCDCGSMALNVKSPPGEYETSVRCATCGGEWVCIHSG